MTAVPTDDRARWGSPAFSVEGRCWSWADVAAFARRDGRWDELVREAAEGLAGERAGIEVDPAAVKQVATDFRYRHRLITAEETEAWLRAHLVEVDEWTAWARRSVLRAEHPAVVGGDGELPAGAEVDALLWPTGRCGGLLDELALALAERVAAHVRVTGALPDDDGDVDTAVARLRAAVVTPEPVRAVLASRQLDWLRVDLETATFETESAAREAALSVRDEGQPLADVCALAGAGHERSSRFLEEVEGELRAAVLGAHEGDLVGPLPAEDGFVLARVAAKVVPSVDDADVRRRAEDVALATVLRREVEQRVRWA